MWSGFIWDSKGGVVLLIRVCGFGVVTNRSRWQTMWDVTRGDNPTEGGAFTTMTNAWEVPITSEDMQDFLQTWRQLPAYPYPEHSCWNSGHVSCSEPQTRAGCHKQRSVSSQHVVGFTTHGPTPTGVKCSRNSWQLPFKAAAWADPGAKPVSCLDEGTILEILILNVLLEKDGRTSAAGFLALSSPFKMLPGASARQPKAVCGMRGSL